MPGIAALMVQYDDYEYVYYAAQSVLPSVDKLLILWNRFPWNGFSCSEDKVKTQEVMQQLYMDKIEIIRTEFKDETSQRNWGMEYLKDEGFDYVIYLDTDEILSQDFKSYLPYIINTLESCDVILLKHEIYFRSLHWIIDPSPHWVGMIGRSALRFKKNRHTIQDVYKQFKGPIVHHPAYCKTPNRILSKINHFSHFSEITKEWYNNVFLPWTPESKDFHPTNPEAFKSVKRQLLYNLPELLQDHPFIMQDIVTEELPHCKFYTKEIDSHDELNYRSLGQ